MKDEAQRRRAERLHGLTEQDRLEYYRREHALLVKRQIQLRNHGVEGEESVA